MKNIEADIYFSYIRNIHNLYLRNVSYVIREGSHHLMVMMIMKVGEKAFIADDQCGESYVTAVWWK